MGIIVLLTNVICILLSHHVVAQAETNEAQTMNIILKQQFFNDLSSKFIAPFLGDLKGKPLGTFKNKQFDFATLFTTMFNLTNVQVGPAQINGGIPILQILENEARFQLD